MKTALEEMADNIRNAQIAEQEQLSNADKLRVQSEANYILEEFETAFAPELEILKESGVTWSAQHQDKRYSSQGFYIQFEREGKILKMDFSNRHSYRYEHVPYSSNRTGSMTYGSWSKEQFILFIHDGLFGNRDYATAPEEEVGTNKNKEDNGKI
ncbi:hypothetical protein M2451_002601 [Dysgonomonas sp. PFB1-18]|uniref:hypothetical protein n=1 Tax=unclassified Dysgonomonas TaxID=2630389 RepID=UPI002473F25B|nr:MULTISPECIES: hypothetical protein [unclassified Dysgonomonas]MDH6308082.1 hypothetical protein [Dysgonomonas sp. PF1-14]MDH6339621.1 hypothetical protein [Dysgonomonas sp. PF1-16]MDH6381272.1 hypothetical protein [Dysgonomonas sp. PFB1-18]MDH6398484.1 hypothetical protein [Dysgonomonas sp. PF1-23]